REHRHIASLGKLVAEAIPQLPAMSMQPLADPRNQKALAKGAARILVLLLGARDPKEIGASPIRRLDQLQIADLKCSILNRPLPQEDEQLSQKVVVFRNRASLECGLECRGNRLRFDIGQRS